MSFSQRFALFLAFAVGVIWFTTQLNPAAPPADPNAPAASGAEAGSGASGASGAAAASGASGASGATGAAASPVEPTADAVDAVEARIASELIAYEVGNSNKGTLRAVETLSPQFEEPNGKGLDFLNLDARSSLSVDFVQDGTDFGWAKSDWTHDVAASREGKVFALRRATPEVEVTQRIEMGKDYEAKLIVEVVNRSGREQTHQLEIATRMGQTGEEGQYDIHRSLCRTQEEVEDFDKSDLDEAPEIVTGGIRWLGVDSKYFGHYVVPGEAFATCEAAMASDASYLAATGVMPAASLAPGASKTYTFGLFTGAKEEERLASFATVAGANLEDAIDWGWFGGLSKSIGGLMLRLLRYFYDLTGMWGVAIILLTCVVKLITLPLTLKQYRSMRKMKEIQPEMAKIKEKYGDDRMKQSQEMQALFKRTGVNPLAGCFPMLVQFPVWIALYAMLGTVVELYHESFLWLPDLTKADGLYILPALMGALMFLQMRIQPSAADNEQAKMMQKIMPAVFVVMMLFLPSGLGVYIFANIVLSLIQSFIQLRGPSSPAAAAS